MTLRTKNSSVAFVISALCAVMFLLAARTGVCAETPEQSYCRLLHLSQRPEPKTAPTSFLGIYLSTQEAPAAVPACAGRYLITAAGIVRGSPAQEAGILSDDNIISVNGKEVCGEKETLPAAFRKTIEEFPIGTAVVLTILHGDTQQDITVTLAQRPTQRQPEASYRYGSLCGERSLLEETIHAREHADELDNLSTGLYEMSNVVLNPGTPAEKDKNPLKTAAMTYLMRHPDSAGIAARDISDAVSASMHKADALSSVFREAVRLIDAAPAADRAPEGITFPDLLGLLEQTRLRVDKVFEPLSTKDREALMSAAFEPWEDEQWNTLFEQSLLVNRQELFNAFMPLIAALNTNAIDQLKKDAAQRFADKTEPILYDATTPFGRVIVGGPGPNTYQHDAALILDLGGDDLYLNNAGGTREGMPVALVIDWEGNDRYISRQPFSQGAGLFGGGILIDLGGDDTFTALDGSQGTGIFGIGMLSHGSGSSVFQARGFSQAAARMGVGLLTNGTGNSVYACSRFCQGLGLYGGAGVMIDDGGDDRYQLGGLKPDFRDPEKATDSLGQGFGFGIRDDKGGANAAGGVGILIEHGGNDVYIGDYFAQGAAYFFGLGILDDRGGNDRYIAGRYSQGAGIHSAVGVMLDRSGDDSYYSSVGVGQGMGHDYGIGFLEDDHGNDSYWGGSLVQGAATRGSIGILFDQGGNDSYSSSAQGQAYGENGGMGVMINTPPGKDSVSRQTESDMIRIGVAP